MMLRSKLRSILPVRDFKLKSNLRQKRLYSSGYSVNYEDIAKKYIQEHPVMLFSKSYCPFCHESKRIFGEMGVKHYAIELDRTDNGNKIQDALMKISNQSSVPNIFIKGTHIGGCSDLIEKRTSGNLHKIMDEAGVKYEKK